MTITTKHTRLMTEAELQSAVTDMLDIYGWQWHHETDSRKSRAGFPDIIAVHPTGRFLLIELKGYDKRGRLGKVTDGQRQWIDVWRLAAIQTHPHRVRAYIWDPADLQSGYIQRTLKETKL